MRRGLLRSYIGYCDGVPDSIQLVELCFGIAVHAAVLPLRPVGQNELVGDLLLDRSDAAGVLAADDVDQALRKFGLVLLNADFIFNESNGVFFFQKSIAFLSIGNFVGQYECVEVFFLLFSLPLL